MEETKLCPKKLNDTDVELSFGLCDEKKCAWWIEYEDGTGACAIYEIAMCAR